MIPSQQKSEKHVCYMNDADKGYILFVNGFDRSQLCLYMGHLANLTICLRIAPSTTLFTMQ